MNKKKSTFLGALFWSLLLAIGVETFTMGIKPLGLAVAPAASQELFAKLPSSPGDDGPPAVNLC